MSGANRFTPTQTKILAVLADGLPHTREELRQCVDELASLKVMQMHLSLIRRVLRPAGQDVLCELVHRRITYRHVRLLHSTADGTS